MVIQQNQIICAIRNEREWKKTRIAFVLMRIVNATWVITSVGNIALEYLPLCIDLRKQALVEFFPKFFCTDGDDGNCQKYVWWNLSWTQVCATRIDNDNATWSPIPDSVIYFHFMDSDKVEEHWPFSYFMTVQLTINLQRTTQCRTYSFESNGSMKKPWPFSNKCRTFTAHPSHFHHLEGKSMDRCRHWLIRYENEI